MNFSNTRRERSPRAASITAPSKRRKPYPFVVGGQTLGELVACRTLYMRIGVGPRRVIAGYNGSVQATGALEQFVRATRIPTPTLVIDGGMEHEAVGVFDAPFPPEGFERLSIALSRAARLFGVKFDLPSARNRCCLLRIPGTSTTRLTRAS
jgi:hypothetical protein